MNTITAFGHWIQNQLLGMQWLKEAVGRGLSFLGLDSGITHGREHTFFSL